MKGAGNRLKADSGDYLYVIFRSEIPVYIFLAFKGGEIVGLMIIDQKTVRKALLLRF